MQEKFKKGTENAIKCSSIGDVREALIEFIDTGGICNGKLCWCCPGDFAGDFCFKNGWIGKDAKLYEKDPILAKNATDALEFIEEQTKTKKEK